MEKVCSLRTATLGLELSSTTKCMAIVRTLGWSETSIGYVTFKDGKAAKICEYEEGEMVDEFE